MPLHHPRKQTLPRHRWDAPRMVEVTVGDEPDAWRAAGFEVSGNGLCLVGSTTFRLVGKAGGRGVVSCRVEAGTSAPLPLATNETGSRTIDANGMLYHIDAPGTNPPLPATCHPSTCTSILKLEVRGTAYKCYRTRAHYEPKFLFSFVQWRPGTH